MPLPMAPGSVATALMTLCCVIFVGQAAEYIVGGGAGEGLGWNFGVEKDWQRGKQPFAVGDVLVFQYPANNHNVVQVKQDDYTRCTAGAGAKVHNSGNDRIMLTQSGKYFFICSIPGRCDGGMKIAVTVN